MKAVHTYIYVCVCVCALKRCSFYLFVAFMLLDLLVELGNYFLNVSVTQKVGDAGGEYKTKYRGAFSSL